MITNTMRRMASAKLTPSALAAMPATPSAPMPISFQRFTSSVTGFISARPRRYRRLDITDPVDQLIHTGVNAGPARCGLVFCPSSNV